VSSGLGCSWGHWTKDQSPGAGITAAQKASLSSTLIPGPPSWTQKKRPQNLKEAQQLLVHIQDAMVLSRHTSTSHGPVRSGFQTEKKRHYDPVKVIPAPHGLSHLGFVVCLALCLLGKWSTTHHTPNPQGFFYMVYS
jgi:hypothetical protein